ncbi:beta-glucosidase, partial [Nonomuraea sp. NN258]|uniref:cellulose binding domain-containing protein n=1 Tax=Nonomuraea antri TaxID=2730852 RepID=UPI0015693A23
GTPAAASVTASSADLTWAAATDDVGVTGYEVVRVQGTAETAVATSASASASVTGLSAGTAYTFAVYARDAAGNRSPRSGTVTVTTRPDGGTGRCAVTAGVQSQWGTGYVVQATVTNPGGAAISGWAVTFTLPPGHQITGSWNGVVSRSGQVVTVRNAPHNGDLGPGGGTSFGFQSSRPDGDTHLPTGYACT